MADRDPDSTGLHVSALSREALDAARLLMVARRVQRDGVAVVPLSSYTRPRSRGPALSSATAWPDTAQISTGLQLLAGALREA